jgi:hypothetical protein
LQVRGVVFANPVVRYNDFLIEDGLSARETYQEIVSGE